MYRLFEVLVKDGEKENSRDIKASNFSTKKLNVDRVATIQSYL